MPAKNASQAPASSRGHAGSSNKKLMKRLEFVVVRRIACGACRDPQPGTDNRRSDSVPDVPQEILTNVRSFPVWADKGRFRAVFPPL
jgi:hypothetical protein